MTWLGMLLGCGTVGELPTADEVIAEWVAEQPHDFADCGLQLGDCQGEREPLTDEGQCFLDAQRACEPARGDYDERHPDGGVVYTTHFVVPSDDGCETHLFLDTSGLDRELPTLTHEVCGVAAIPDADSCATMYWGGCDEIEWWYIARP